MNVVDLTRELIAIPSVNPNSLADPSQSAGEAKMAQRITEILGQLKATSIDKWDTYPGRPSVSGYLDFGAPETLIFDTHLDTVPVEGMVINPFTGELRDGRVYGRGACDMKGPMAAMLCALYELKTSGAAVKYNVLFAATADEEAGFGGVRSFVNRLNPSNYAPIAGAIVAEPTNLNPVAAHKGTCRWRITTDGIAAHSSMPQLGRNAIYSMAPVITVLESFATELLTRTPHEKLGYPTLSIGTIHGGSAANIVPDHCAIQVDRRLIPGESPEFATDELTALLGDTASISKPTVAAPPMETAEDSDLVRRCVAAAAAAGANSIVEYANYCTNASFYPAAGIPPVVFGPGCISQAHTKDEWISVEALEAGVQAYKALLL